MTRKPMACTVHLYAAASSTPICVYTYMYMYICIHIYMYITSQRSATHSSALQHTDTPCKLMACIVCLITGCDVHSYVSVHVCIYV